jgi:uncharacterized HhH-GPD family protein
LPIPTAEAPSKQQLAVAAKILQFGADHSASEKPFGQDFTSNPAANDLLKTDPFAFLCGVIFDQNIPSERVWLAPFLLKERLGFLDPETVAAEEGAVRDAIQREPKLHRYVNTVPGWIVKAAQRVLDCYDGDASRIWSDNPTADVLQKRFEQFVGIAQKKAAAAVEFLESELGVPVRNMERGDIAYDVHIRRVFLRAGLADRDKPDVVIAAARRLNPERPGALDLPTWYIGRGWCHPRVPDCAACPLSKVCPKKIGRAAHLAVS